MSLQEFHKEFKDRHDFEDDDLELLQDRHPKTQITNIPIAWIIIIDELLCRDRKVNKIKAIDQSYGFIVINYRGDSSVSERLGWAVEDAERKVRELDIDLYEKYGY